MATSSFQYMTNVASVCLGEAKSAPSSQSASGSIQQKIVLTDNFGHPVGDVTHVLNISGYPLASDAWMMEKQQTFNRAKIVERAVHPCGAGAFGYFEVTNPNVSKYCKADFLSEMGKKTPIFLRFSTVTLGKEFPDSARNPRGFAVKFYTTEGNYDIVGLNFPVFFTRDPALGPDAIRSQQRNPSNFLIDYNALFDFVSLVPESVHAATMLFSDHGTPDGFRRMHGYGCHTFKWVSEKGEQFYVKYQFIAEEGTKNFTWDQAVRMCGEDPDYAKRDLWDYIQNGGTPTWKACVQIMPVEKASNCTWDPFDVTKVWHRDDFPLMEFGRLVLNRNPDNYHRDVEQAAFSPGSLVPGIEPSPDPLLQFRCFFYRDAQLYRLGTNMHQVPVNCPFRSKYLCPFARDGNLRLDANGSNLSTASGGVEEPHYFPNSAGKAVPSKIFDWQIEQITGIMARKSPSKHVLQLDEELAQARDLYCNVMSQPERENLHLNIAVALRLCRRDIQMRTLVMLHKVFPAYARGVIEHMMKLFEKPSGAAAITGRPALHAKADNLKKPITFEEVEEISRKLPMLSDPLNNYQLTDLANKLIPPPSIAMGSSKQVPWLQNA